MTSNPKAFISYSWSSPEHQQWVLDLATQLTENGVDVTIDTWDLREGHDAIKFMERMVTDPAIKKVIIVLDRTYARKADDRKGGVGTESQIISPEIYARADQDKFVGVASETDPDGRPFLPTFYKSRIYIDLSHADIYATNFDQLLRWLYDKPAHPKPRIGKRPEFLNENAIQLPTHSRANRATDLLKSGSSLASGAIDEYFSIFAESLEEFRIPVDKLAGQTIFDDPIVQSIDSFLPYRDEFIRVVSTLARYSTVNNDKTLRRFFEKLIPYMFPPKSLTQYHEWYWDNYKFVIHEMFLYSIGFLLKHERFEDVLQLMSQGYYVGKALDSLPMQQFDTIYQDMSSLEHRKKRLRLNRKSIRADMLEQRSHTSGLSLLALMQADFVLFLFNSIKSVKEKGDPRWWPQTLSYYRSSAPFEIFARAESLKYFQKICPLIAVESKAELEQAFKLFSGSQPRLSLPYLISLEDATNFSKLVSKP
jgi:hypothetical protein